VKYKNVELHNVCDIIEDDEVGFAVSRLPLDVRENVNQGARNNSLHSAGCEIRGMLKEGGKAKIVLQSPDDNVYPPIATIFHGCFRRVISKRIAEEPTEIEIDVPNHIELMTRIAADKNMPFDPHLVRVRLPSIHPCRVISIEGDLTYPTPESTPSSTMLSYGSSITHGAHAIPPEGTYTAQCARQLGCDLINLGFGGSAHMDKAIAHHIASRDDWDFATFEMGINVRSWEPERFRDAVDYFVSTIASAHPDKHIFCIDLFTNNCDFMDNPKEGVGFRDIVKDIAAKQKSDKVIYVDGRSVLSEPSGLSIDLVHPTDDGMSDMGRNLADIIARERKI
jgi:hypothetical protein